MQSSGNGTGQRENPRAYPHSADQETLGQSLHFLDLSLPSAERISYFLPQGCCETKLDIVCEMILS